MDKRLPGVILRISLPVMWGLFILRPSKAMFLGSVILVLIAMTYDLYPLARRDLKQFFEGEEMDLKKAFNAIVLGVGWIMGAIIIIVSWRGL